MPPDNSKQLKIELNKKLDEAKKRHFAKEDGISISSFICNSVDNIITDLYNNEESPFDGAIIATGGHGRGHLNPYSDIDLLFLSDHKVAPPEYFIGHLWDLGLKVGHSFRTIEESIDLGSVDLATRTSMMETRLLIGDTKLYQKFLRKYFLNLVKPDSKNYIEQKIIERDYRHDKYGKFLKLTEPDLKESPGGLRDYHHAFWLLASKLARACSSDILAELNLFSNDQLYEIENGYSYLLRIRNSIHFISLKNDNLLLHSKQPEVALIEEYAGSVNESCATLMTNYYKAAETLYRFNEKIIEFVTSFRPKTYLETAAIGEVELFTDNKYLFANNFPPTTTKLAASIIYTIVLWLEQKKLKPSSSLFEGTKQLIANMADKDFQGENGSILILFILELDHSERGLRLLRDSGALAKLVPLFGLIENLSQFDMYHRYSVDEHTINAIGKLEAIQDGESGNQLLEKLYTQTADILIIKLALLGHDLGKQPIDRHGSSLDTIAAPLLKHLKLDEYLDDLQFLISNHLLMSEFAQRRDFNEPSTFKKFVDRVKNIGNLRKLYLLTYADIAAVGPGIWNEWKNHALTELYIKSERYFTDQYQIDDKEKEGLVRLKTNQLADKISNLLPAKGRKDKVQNYITTLTNQYIYKTSLKEMKTDFELISKLETQAVAIKLDQETKGEITKILVAGKEKIGFFSSIAGFFAYKKISIVEGVAQTFAGSFALNKLLLANMSSSILNDPTHRKRFEKELSNIINDSSDLENLIANRKKYLQAEDDISKLLFKPAVMITNHISDHATIIEIWAKDKVGLLYNLAKTIASLDLSIRSAKISTEGIKAINVFYITTKNSKKVEDKDQIKMIKKTIETTILV